MHRHLIFSLGALLLAASGIASAQNAYTAKPMNLRAGPNRDYPAVAQLDAGAPLDVHGCLDGYSWCDVSFEDARGWLYAGGISFVYNGDRVPLYSYGPRLGLPIVTFSVGTYWGSYYRSRPFYAQRNTWAHRHFPAPSRAPGRSHAGPPPMSHGRPPVNGHPEGRPEEHGHTSQGQPGRMERQPQHAPAQEHAPTRHAPTPREKGPPQNSHTRAPHGEDHPKNPP
ncbi:MAG TPA: SH3 domain-containing protein [Steroidobacteraceae bacterium]|jgi:uncharacterized protein YraI